jgi:DNA-binding beta-propeller fold protein YncE
VVTTIAGAGGGVGYRDGPALEALFDCPQKIAIYQFGTIYIGDQWNKRIRMLSPTGTVTTLAGTGEWRFNDAAYNYKDGLGSEARFNLPEGVAVGPDGAVYVADTIANRIRKIVIE